ncbi:MAG: hypothetical protein HQK51_18585 [Oligoflexia bacterium]|nr:hypothetical protein [Oligoflexia bacterium]
MILIIIYSTSNLFIYAGVVSDTRFGADQAVVAFTEEDGFKLSERASKTLGIKFIPIQGQKQFTTHKSALVKIKATKGVYRRYEGWISYVLINDVKIDGEKITFSSDDLQSGDEVAISGTDFLRMTEVDLTTSTVAGCAH